MNQNKIVDITHSQIVQRGYDCTVWYYPNGDDECTLRSADFIIGDEDELFVRKNFVKLNTGLDSIGNMTYCFLPERFVTEINLEPHYEVEERKPDIVDDYVPFGDSFKTNNGPVGLIKD